MGIASVNGIELAYEVHGDPEGVPLLLICGLGQQLVGWHPDLLKAMTRRGYRVMVFDNRDVGLSTHFDHFGHPDLPAILAGRDPAPYRLEDLAADAVGLLDALGLDSAHVFGVSMGGMVAQLVAVGYPDRVRSLISVMSHPGDRRVRPAPEADALLVRPAATTLEEFVEAAEESARIIGSPEFMPDLQWLRRRAQLTWERRYNSAGVARQLAAILTAADRTEALGRLSIPALVVHGSADPLVPVLGGRLTAAAIPAAELLEIDGMGHDLPRQVWDRILDRVEDVVHRGETDRRSGLASIG